MSFAPYFPRPKFILVGKNVFSIDFFYQENNKSKARLQKYLKRKKRYSAIGQITCVRNTYVSVCSFCQPMPTKSLVGICHPRFANQIISWEIKFPPPTFFCEILNSCKNYSRPNIQSVINFTLKLIFGALFSPTKMNFSRPM